jgi:hypothetical protein
MKLCNVANIRIAAEHIVEASKLLGSCEIDYTLKCLCHAYELLTQTYCKYPPNSKVKLTKAPLINSSNASGWVGCQHFLIKGAKAVVKSVDVRSDGIINYSLVFDDESFIDAKGDIIPIKDHHTFSFGEDFIESQFDGVENSLVIKELSKCISEEMDSLRKENQLYKDMIEKVINCLKPE